MAQKRDRDPLGRAKNARPRDALGRPLPRGATPELPAEEPEPDPATALDRGIAHFNAGEYFQAHEVWEEGWHPAEESERDFWQGVIQVAVGLTHRQRGNPRGAVTLLERGARRLRKYGDTHNGVRTAEIAQFAEDAARTIEAEGLDAHIDVPRIRRG
ncbi:MAG: DUF309 domain-containing protein [Actinomycetota bacterium]|nr:DUF309 domain-containing protein [Actinomycetota bacterium]